MITVNSKNFKINLPKLHRDAVKSWIKEFDGKNELGIDMGISEEELPFIAFKNQIDRCAYLEDQFKNDSFRFQIIKIQSLEAKLKFILRYNWVYIKNKKYPFKTKWVYDEYKKISSESDIRQSLID
jgi:hypothetical protein